jgi:hypothetical protein
VYNSVARKIARVTDLNSEIAPAPGLSACPIPPHGTGQSDIDPSRRVADDIDGAASSPVVEEFAEPAIAYPRVPLGGFGAN